MTSHTLNSREVATVLAALRLWQRQLHSGEVRVRELDIACDDGTLDPLDEAEIDLLCERLNVVVPAVGLEHAP